MISTVGEGGGAMAIGAVALGAADAMRATGRGDT
jgi:hypothetical protein